MVTRPRDQELWDSLHGNLLLRSYGGSEKWRDLPYKAYQYAMRIPRWQIREWLIRGRQKILDNPGKVSYYDYSPEDESRFCSNTIWLDPIHDYLRLKGQKIKRYRDIACVELACREINRAALDLGLGVPDPNPHNGYQESPLEIYFGGIWPAFEEIDEELFVDVLDRAIDNLSSPR